MLKKMVAVHPIPDFHYILISQREEYPIALMIKATIFI
jgi:hypothetical protein